MDKEGKAGSDFDLGGGLSAGRGRRGIVSTERIGQTLFLNVAVLL